MYIFVENNKRKLSINVFSMYYCSSGDNYKKIATVYYYLTIM